MYWREQILLQSRDNFTKRPVESSRSSFPNRQWLYSHLQCDVGIDQALMNADSLLAVHISCRDCSRS